MIEPIKRYDLMENSDGFEGMAEISNGDFMKVSDLAAMVPALEAAAYWMEAIKGNYIDDSPSV